MQKLFCQKQQQRQGSELCEATLIYLHKESGEGTVDSGDPHYLPTSLISDAAFDCS